MGNRKERVHVRLSREELDHLKMCAKSSGGKFKNGRVNFSDYLRVQLLSGSGYRDEVLIRQLRELKYELRKIGTNVNQIARKINSGFGVPQDLERLTGYLARIEEAFAKLELHAEGQPMERDEEQGRKEGGDLVAEEEKKMAVETDKTEPVLEVGLPELKELVELMEEGQMLEVDL